MSLQQVSLTTSPAQTFAAALTIDGNPITLNLTVSYNEMAGYWTLSISDVNNNLLVDSVPMITGSWPAANLLEQQRYLGIGSWYVVNTSNINGQSGASGYGFGQGGFGQGPYGGALGFGGIDYPDNTNLGSDFQLWVGDTPLS